MTEHLNDKLSLQVHRIWLNVQLKGRRCKVSPRNISFSFKIVVLHVPWKNERQIYKLIWCKRKATATKWDLCHLVVLEGQNAVKALAPSARNPCRTKDKSSSTTPSMDLAQMLCLPAETLKDTQAQMKSSQISPGLPLLNLDVCHLGRAHYDKITRFRSISSFACHPSLTKEQINATDKVCGIGEQTGFGR